MVEKKQEYRHAFYEMLLSTFIKRWTENQTTRRERAARKSENSGMLGD